MKRFPVLVAVSTAVLGANPSALVARPLTIADLERRERVADARISPDGEQILYTVTRIDVAADVKRSSVWRVDWRGGVPKRLTPEMESASKPRWSPNGRRISFLKAGEDSEGMQLWLLDRAGGEATRATDVPGGIVDYAWAPDGDRLALVHQPAARDHSVGGALKPQPWVIDRYRFKIDAGDGYLHARWSPPRILLHDLRTGVSAALTMGEGFEETDPAWSPDGRSIAFLSNREPDRDRTDCTDVFVAPASPGAAPRRLTDFPGMDSGPLSWSPDGKEIAFLQGGEPKYWMFEQLQLAVVPFAGGATRRLTDALDRDIGDVAFSSRDESIRFLVTDDRRLYPARVPRAGGRAERLSKGDEKILSFSEAEGRVAVIATSDTMPAEVHALERGVLRRLTRHNDSWLSGVELARVEDLEFPAGDGERVHGLLTKPIGYEPGRRYPTILWIHGGPYLQDSHGFNSYPTYDARQLFAANGYAVVQINYRGSKGRGARFGRGTFADWGNKDVSDLLAGVDHVVGMGVADPQRLGVGGWSFGGFLTNYLIVSDPRFKAAISGAGSGHKIASYGADLYAAPNELEFGAPWDNPEVWQRISRPLLQAGRIRTPTLFVSGEKDFNVPVAGSEQMYQALKSLRVPTRLVVYPGEHHMIERPSFERDLMQRYLDWYARYLKEDSRT
jgi:dipeptidyl aminopeptidase/acylaminoacyl peptidase